MALLEKNLITKKHIFSVLIIILLIGSLLRFYGLSNQSLRLDELYSWKSGNHETLFEAIKHAAAKDVHPPGYHIILYFLEKYIGDTETILRLPSAISGVLSIFVIFLLGTRIYSYQEALISSALMAVLWCPIYYSQEVRPFSILLLFTMLATYYWIQMLKELNEKEKVSFYIICFYSMSAIISSYLHYFGLYLIFLQGLVIALFFIRSRQRLFYILITYSLIICAYLPWIPVMLQHASYKTPHILAPTRYAFIDYLQFLFNNSKVLTLIVLTFYLFLCVSNLYSVCRTKAYTKLKTFLLSPDMWVILWLIVPFIGVYIASKLSTPSLQNRNLIISLPAAYLLLSRSIVKLPVSSQNQRTIAVVIVVVFLLQLVFFQDYYSKPHKQQFREAANFIIKQDHLNDDSFIIDHLYDPDFLNYYFEKAGSTRRVSPEAYSFDVDEARFASYNKKYNEKAEPDKLFQTAFNNDANAIKKRNSRFIWYICYKPQNEYFGLLNSNFKLIDHKSFLYVKVFLFENRMSSKQ